MRIFCFFGYHRRSAKLAKFDGDTFVSKCQRCGVGMTKQADGSWSVNDRAETSPPP